MLWVFKLQATESYMQSAGLTETRPYPPTKTLLKPPNPDIKTNARILYIACCAHVAYSKSISEIQISSYFEPL